MLLLLLLMMMMMMMMLAVDASFHVASFFGMCTCIYAILRCQSIGAIFTT